MASISLCFGQYGMLMGVHVQVFDGPKEQQVPFAAVRVCLGGPDFNCSGCLGSGPAVPLFFSHEVSGDPHFFAGMIVVQPPGVI